MYLATRTQGPAVHIGRRVLAGNVLALGIVSMVTDISAEMVTAVLPLYLVAGLGLSPLQFGLIDGIYTGATVVARLAGGHAADRWQKRKFLAGTGYSLSALAKLGLLAAGSSTAALGGAIAADRFGKGIRTAPRDALISLSVPQNRLGAAFGAHRMLDTLGALLGPLVAFAVLAGTGNAFDAVFVTSFCIATLGVLLLVLFVQEYRQPLDRAAVSMRGALKLARSPGVLRICALTMLLGAVTIGDGFVYLVLARQNGLASAYFPLLPLATAISYLSLAVPFGRLADWAGRLRLFLGGHLLLLCGYAMLTVPLAGTAAVVIVPLLLGGCYAATDGVLMALAGPMFAAAVRGTGLAVVQSAQALGRLSGAIVFGAVWTARGMTPALICATTALGLAIFAGWIVLRRKENR